MEREFSQKEKAAGRFICLFAYRCVVKIILSMHILTLLCFLWFICQVICSAPTASLCAVKTAKDKCRNYFVVILSRAQSLNLNLVYCFPLPNLSGAPDWSCRVASFLEPIKRDNPDLGSGMSSEWNFCTFFSDVISLGNQ